MTGQRAPRHFHWQFPCVHFLMRCRYSFQRACNVLGGFIITALPLKEIDFSTRNHNDTILLSSGYPTFFSSRTIQSGAVSYLSCVSPGECPIFCHLWPWSLKCPPCMLMVHSFPKWAVCANDKPQSVLGAQTVLMEQDQTQTHHRKPGVTCSQIYLSLFDRGPHGHVELHVEHKKRDICTICPKCHKRTMEHVPTFRTVVHYVVWNSMGKCPI